jgi:hypothetical protein
VRRIITLSVLAVLMLAGAAQAQDKATYVGSKGCMCHNSASKGAIPTSWAATKHASALTTLEKADEKVTAEWAAKLKVEVKGPAAKSPECLKCHVVGYGKGGYGADPANDVKFAGVGCEDCHGAASLHIKAATADKAKTMTPLPTEAACKVCHTAVTSPKFDFAAALKAGMPHAKPPAAPPAAK